MSQVVDEYLLEQMRREDDADLLFGNIDGTVMDHLCAYDEETGTYDPSEGLLFPQPEKVIK